MITFNTKKVNLFQDKTTWEKGLMFSRNDTTYYTIPYKNFTTKVFFNLYIEKAKDYMAIFKIQYLKGSNYNINKQDIRTKLVPFHFNKNDFNIGKLNIACVDTTFRIDVPCTGDNHSPGDGSCNCGGSADCDPAYTIEIPGEICYSVPSGGSTTGPTNPYEEDPYDGVYGGGNTGNNDGTTIVIDPNDNTLFYNICKSNNENDCWKYCDGSIDCEPKADELYALHHVLKISEEETDSLAEHATEILQYIDNGGSKALARDFAKIDYNYNDVRFDRYLELDSIIKENPWALVENCMQNEGLDKYDFLPLFGHNIQQDSKDYLDDLGSGFSNQPLEEGNTALANVDYYGIEITQMPDFGSGTATSVELFGEFKKEFPNLASGQKNNFQFSCDNPIAPSIDDIGWDFDYYPATLDRNQIRWNGPNPNTTIFKIDGWAADNTNDWFSDLGAIIISDFTSQHWIGSTIKTPITDSQPFSGNREWGYRVNNDSKIELYTKAVDVATIVWYLDILSFNDECNQETYYNIANATWENLQEKIKIWVEQHNGIANIKTPKVAKIKRSYLIDFLTSDTAINLFLCD